MREYSLQKFVSIMAGMPLDSFDVADVGGKKRMAFTTVLGQNHLKVSQINPFFKSYTTFNIEESTDVILDILQPVPTVYMNRYDLVLSFDALEHITDPFRACSNMIVMGKPGGYIYMATVFSWKLHGRGDYFRFSPDGLRLCFKGVTEISCGWDEDDHYIKRQTGVYFFGRIA